MQCGRCGRYLKATAEYTVTPLDKVQCTAGDRCRAAELWDCKQWQQGERRMQQSIHSKGYLDRPRCQTPTLPQGRKHPDNDARLTDCSRCGCPADAHEVVEVRRSPRLKTPAL